MTFSTANAAEAPANMGNGPKYMTVGVNEGVTFAGFTTGATSKGTEFLEAAFTKGEEGPDQSRVADKFYMSEKAQPMSLRKVQHILVDGLGVAKDKVDAVTADTLDAYAAALNKLIPKGHSLRTKFVGEEYDSAGTIKTAKRIGMPPFAEPMSVPATLKYDASNAYDFKRLPVPDAASYATTNTAAATADLPF